jgi:hypothetical protein
VRSRVFGYSICLSTVALRPTGSRWEVGIVKSFFGGMARRLQNMGALDGKTGGTVPLRRFRKASGTGHDPVAPGASVPGVCLQVSETGPKGVALVATAS